jgi:hypothetical protein
VGHLGDENQIAGHARSGLSGALPDPGSTPGASTKPNDLAEPNGQRTGGKAPGSERDLKSGFVLVRVVDGASFRESAAINLRTDAPLVGAVP